MTLIAYVWEATKRAVKANKSEDIPQTLTLIKRADGYIMIDECQAIIGTPERTAEQEKEDQAWELERTNYMLNPSLNPQLALYKAIDSGTTNDIQRAVDAGADLNQAQFSGAIEYGAALEHMVIEQNYCVAKARLLIELGCAVNSYMEYQDTLEHYTVLDYLAGEYASRSRYPEDGEDPAPVLALAKLLFQSGFTMQDIEENALLQSHLSAECIEDATALAMAPSKERRI